MMTIDDLNQLYIVQRPFKKATKDQQEAEGPTQW